MKYIRTKDRIVEIKKITIYDKLTVDYIHEKKADTIEELCDEFVYETNKGNYATKHKNTDIAYFFNDERPIAYYGAIWVKGEHNEPILKSVAQMNEKGELELL